MFPINLLAKQPAVNGNRETSRPGGRVRVYPARTLTWARGTGRSRG